MWHDTGPNIIEETKYVSQKDLKHALQNLDKNKFPSETIEKAKVVVELMNQIEKIKTNSKRIQNETKTSTS